MSVDVVMATNDDVMSDRSTFVEPQNIADDQEMSEMHEEVAHRTVAETTDISLAVESPANVSLAKESPANVSLAEESPANVVLAEESPANVVLAEESPATDFISRESPPSQSNLFHSA